MGRRQVSREEAEKLALENDMEYVEASAKSGQNVTKVRAELYVSVDVHGSRRRDPHEDRERDAGHEVRGERSERRTGKAWGGGEEVLERAAEHQRACGNQEGMRLLIPCDSY